MIINFHFMQYFLLEHDDLNLCKCFVTFYDDFLSDYDRILRVSKFCGKIITSVPFFSTENPYSKFVLGRSFLIVNRFSKFL